MAAARKLVLGGVRIPFDRGPVGHSDGDALAHAICDALLERLTWATSGATSRTLLRSGKTPRACSSSATSANCSMPPDTHRQHDATVGLERPKLAPHIPAMEKKVAAALSLNPSQVSVKAKSGEGLDAIGRGEALRADAVALIQARSLSQRVSLR